MARHPLSRITHAFPGEHYLAIRPIRDDLRRSVVEVPRRGRKRRARTHRREERKAGKRMNKQLTRDTHKGRPAKSTHGVSAKRAPTTQKAQHPGYSGLRAAHKPQTLKQTGIKVHRPRALQPHPPRLYHVLPVRRIYDKLAK